MKNLFLVSFVALLFLTLAGCGGKGSSHESSNDQGAGKNQGPGTNPTPVPTPSGTPANGTIGNQSNPGPAQGAPACDGSGPIGDYSGYALAADGKSFVPLTLNIAGNKAPTTTGSQTQASLQIGLFGGVTIGTPTAVYTFQNGEFTATFASSTTGGTQLTLDGKIRCGVFVDTILQGRLRSYPVTLSKGTKSPFTRGNSSYNYDVTFPGVGNGVRGVMTVLRLGGTTPSNDFSDLPTIPALKTTFQFDDHTTIVADTAMYDPLGGALELSLGSNVTFVKCSSVTLKEWAGDLAAPQLVTKDKNKKDVASQGIQCVVSSGGAIPQKLLATRNESRIIPKSPQYYVGKWKPVDPNVDQFAVVADVTYSGSDGVNPAGYLFPKFPALSAKIYTCNEGAFNTQITVNAIAMDQVTGKAIFATNAAASTTSPTGNNPEYYQPTYSFGWGLMSGPLVTQNSGEVGSPTISLQPYVGKWQGCNIPTKN
jgi:hypothetical protein